MLSYTVVSQELSVESNLEGITLKIGEEFSPNSYAKLTEQQKEN